MLLSNSTSPSLEGVCYWKYFLCRQHRLWKTTKPSPGDGNPVAHGNSEWWWSDRLSARIVHDHEDF